MPLIFDEVVTGFRLAYGGAQEYYGVVPDLCTLGKVIGGGFPLAAIAGREEIMAHFDKNKVGDENFLVQIGTLSGNPVAAAAGLATMAILKRPGAYERIHATGRELMGALGDLLKRAGIAAQVSGEPPLFDVVFTDEPIRDYRSTLSGDPELMRRFNVLLRERGILKGESKYYISLAHTDQDIEDTIGIWKDAIEELKHNAVVIRAKAETQIQPRAVKDGSRPRRAQTRVQSLKNTRARVSMLSRGGASGGVVGSSNAPCAENRAAPSRAELKQRISTTSSASIFGK